MIVCNLSRILGERRMSQATLARTARVNPATISTLYHDRWQMVDRTVLRQICTALQIQPGELLTWQPET